MMKVAVFIYLQLLLTWLLSSSVIAIPGFADDGNSTSKKSSGNSTTVTIVIVFLGVLAVVAFSVFLYKLWERKKREEQRGHHD